MAVFETAASFDRRAACSTRLARARRSESFLTRPHGPATEAPECMPSDNPEMKIAPPAVRISSSPANVSATSQGPIWPPCDSRSRIALKTFRCVLWKKSAGVRASATAPSDALLSRQSPSTSRSAAASCAVTGSSAVWLILRPPYAQRQRPTIGASGLGGCRRQ